MIPVLFKENTRVFNNNGIGHLSDTISCTVTESRNGSYELEMRYPLKGVFFDDLKMSRIIWALPADGKAEQGFRIYKITKPINGIVTILAEHISYQLSSIPCSRFSADSAAGALSGLKQHAATECPFNFWTDVTTAGSFTVEAPAGIRSKLGGSKGSVLDVYGGEYEWDNYDVRLRAQRGNDRGVVLKYGKNITDLKQEENITNTITGVYPYWTDWEEGGEYTELNQKVVLAANAGNFPYYRIVTVDCSEDFEEKPSQEELLNWSRKYMEREGIGIPNVSISVSFVALWQTEEYKNIAPLERVGLCDTVTVEYEELGVSAKAKVIRTVYNVLLERYDRIEIGDATSSIVGTLIDQKREIETKPSAGFLKTAVDNATNWITGTNGGYVILHKDGNGRPYEILIMNTDNINTATQVWRWNKGGLGYSNKGYNGPYATAITQDGKIVADFITAGSMLANIIQGGVLTLGGKENGHGREVILDENGKEIGRWDLNGLIATKGKFSGDLEAAGGTFSGNLQAAGGTFSGNLQAAGGTFSGNLQAAGGNFTGTIKVGNLFSVDSQGNVIANSLKSSNAQITGGKIDIVSSESSVFGLRTTDGSYELGMEAPLFMMESRSGLHTSITAGDVGVRTDDGGFAMMMALDGASYVMADYITAMKSLSSNGTKSRIVDTRHYSKKLLYCYEMPSPMFGDIGTGKTDSSGLTYIYFDQIFQETVTSDMTYYVFLQKEDQGDLWIEEKTPEYFLVKGTPEISFSWEVKVKQRDYEYERMESFDDGEETDIDYGAQAEAYLKGYEREILNYEEVN